MGKVSSQISTKSSLQKVADHYTEGELVNRVLPHSLSSEDALKLRNFRQKTKDNANHTK